MSASELAHRAMLREVARREHPKRHILLQLPRHADGGGNNYVDAVVLTGVVADLNGLTGNIKPVGA